LFGNILPAFVLEKSNQLSLQNKLRLYDIVKIANKFVGDSKLLNTLESLNAFYDVLDQKKHEIYKEIRKINKDRELHPDVVIHELQKTFSELPTNVHELQLVTEMHSLIEVLKALKSVHSIDDVNAILNAIEAFNSRELLCNSLQTMAAINPEMYETFIIALQNKFSNEDVESILQNCMLLSTNNYTDKFHFRPSYWSKFFISSHDDIGDDSKIASWVYEYKTSNKALASSKQAIIQSNVPYCKTLRKQYHDECKAATTELDKYKELQNDATFFRNQELQARNKTTAGLVIQNTIRSNRRGVDEEKVQEEIYEQLIQIRQKLIGCKRLRSLYSTECVDPPNAHLAHQNIENNLADYIATMDYYIRINKPSNIPQSPRASPSVEASEVKQIQVVEHAPLNDLQDEKEEEFQSSLFSKSQRKKAKAKQQKEQSLTHMLQSVSLQQEEKQPEKQEQKEELLFNYTFSHETLKDYKNMFRLQKVLIKGKWYELFVNFIGLDVFQKPEKEKQDQKYTKEINNIRIAKAEAGFSYELLFQVYLVDPIENQHISLFALHFRKASLAGRDWFKHQDETFQNVYSLFTTDKIDQYKRYNLVFWMFNFTISDVNPNFRQNIHALMWAIEYVIIQIMIYETVTYSLFFGGPDMTRKPQDEIVTMDRTTVMDPSLCRAIVVVMPDKQLASNVNSMLMNITSCIDQMASQTIASLNQSKHLKSIHKISMDYLSELTPLSKMYKRMKLILTLLNHLKEEQIQTFSNVEQKSFKNYMFFTPYTERMMNWVSKHISVYMEPAGLIGYDPTTLVEFDTSFVQAWQIEPTNDTIYCFIDKLAATLSVWNNVKLPQKSLWTETVKK